MPYNLKSRNLSEHMFTPMFQGPSHPPADTFSASLKEKHHKDAVMQSIWTKDSSKELEPRTS